MNILEPQPIILVENYDAAKINPTLRFLKKYQA